MAVLTIHPRRVSSDFRVVARSVPMTEGLPLANVLPAVEIERVFRRHDALFGTATMPDTPEHQAELPQQKSQKPGIGFPVFRACVVLSLATACVQDAAWGPYAVDHGGDHAGRPSRWVTITPGRCRSS